MRRVIGAVLAGAVVLALYSAPAEAQPGMAQGVKLGFNKAWFSNGGDSDSKSGIALGYFLSFELRDQLFFQPEILYTMKGGKGTGYEATENYLECQALAKWAPGTPLDVKPVAFGGLSLGFNIKDEVEVTGLGTGDMGAKSIELALVFGGGIEFPVGEGAMSVDLRWSLGLTDVPEDQSVKHSVFTIMLGYKF